MSILMAASNQWATRPADQRFKSLADLHAATSAYRAASVESRGVDIRRMKVEVQADNGEPLLIGERGAVAKFTHYSFGQFASRVGAPAGYLRRLPAPLAADCLNNGIDALADEPPTDSVLFLGTEGSAAMGDPVRLRAVLSDKYTRIWNADVTERLIALTQHSPEWQPAPEAFDGSRGLYASDADMFAFLVDNDRRIFETGPAGGLGRGFFIANSEVGDRALTITTFWYEYVCGNHRVVGAHGVATLRVPHIGRADDRAWRQLGIALRTYANASAVEDERRVQAMRDVVLGSDEDTLTEQVRKLAPSLTQTMIADAYTTAVENEDKYGNPLSVWGFNGGLTQVARDLPQTSERVKIEKAAGQIAQMAF